MSDLEKTQTNLTKADLAESRENAPDNNKPLGEDTSDDEMPDLEALPPPPYSVYNWWQKRLIVFTAAIAGFFSPLSTNIYYPALSVIADDLQVTISQVNLTVTTYMIFQALAPVVIGTMADSYGRRPAYIACFVVYIIANIALALQTNYGALMALRMVQSAGCSGTIALASAVVTDLVTSAERGSYIGMTAIPTVLGPSLSPIIGGLLTQYLGWHSMFWFLTVFSGVIFILLLILLPETCRAIVGNGSIIPPRRNRSALQWMKYGNVGQSPNAPKPPPFKLTKLLGAVKIVCTKCGFLITFYGGIVYAGFYAVSTTITTQFEVIYGLNSLQQGLLFLPVSAGSLVAAAVIGKLIDWNYKRHCVRLGRSTAKGTQIELKGFPIERARLEVAVPMFIVGGIAMMAFGWLVQAKTHIAGPCVLLFIIGYGLVAGFNPLTILIVDLNRKNAGTATAAINLVKCPLGAAAAAIANPMIQAMGNGWAFTTIGLIEIVLVPMLIIVIMYGASWREVQDEKDVQKEAEKRTEEIAAKSSEK